MNILVTGASGFVGSAIMSRLVAEQEYRVSASKTRLDSQADWSSDLHGVMVVIHCAARVHVMRDTAEDPLVVYRAVNVLGTEVLARQAAAAGVKRFVFISSIKVNGEETSLGKPFTADDVPNPQDAYGISKREAEDVLRTIAWETGMEVVIIRPPLVYGPGVKGNFSLVNKLVAFPVPLPLRSIRNKRSLVSRENLVSLVCIVLRHPAAANQTFLVSDGYDFSTPELFTAAASANGSSVWLFPFPDWALYFLFERLGKVGIARRLCASLQIDITKTSELLGWHPVCNRNSLFC